MLMENDYTWEKGGNKCKNLHSLSQTLAPATDNYTSKVLLMG